MTQEQITRNQAFIRDLRVNTKPATRVMRDYEGGRCCLCVAFDTALRLGFEPPEPPECYKYYPPNKLANFYGWPSVNPCLNGHTSGPEFTSTLNNLPTPHTTIADYFEQTFPEIKP